MIVRIDGDTRTDGDVFFLNLSSSTHFVFPTMTCLPNKYIRFEHPFTTGAAI